MSKTAKPRKPANTRKPFPPPANWRKEKDDVLSDNDVATLTAIDESLALKAANRLDKAVLVATIREEYNKVFLPYSEALSIVSKATNIPAEVLVTPFGRGRPSKDKRGIFSARIAAIWYLHEVTTLNQREIGVVMNCAVQMVNLTITNIRRGKVDGETLAIITDLGFTNTPWKVERLPMKGLKCRKK